MLRATVTTLRSTAGGLLAEALNTTAAVTRYIDGFTPVQARISTRPDRDRHHTPVLLVHGLCANKSYWSPLESKLLADGHTVFSVNYGWLNSTIADCGRAIADDAERLLEVTGAHKLHIVGHSLGGVVTKWAMHNTSIAEVTDTVVSLGSPHQGAPLAGLPVGSAIPFLGSIITELRPGHDALHDQDQPLPAGVRWVTVGGGLDLLVPASRAALPGQRHGITEHHVFDKLGHIAMVTHPEVTNLVRTNLAAASTAAAA